MFIKPMGDIATTKQVQNIRNPIEENIFKKNSDSNKVDFKVPFQSLFTSAAKNVLETDAKVSEDVVRMSTGKSDNLHQYGIDITKAQISMELLVELRNKAIDAYNDIIRMNV